MIEASKAPLLSREDVAALRAIAERDAPMVLARDWDSLAALYETDAVRMPPNAPAVEGRDAIRGWFDGLPPIEEFEFRMLDVQGGGDLAFMRAAWSIAVRPPGQDEPFRDSGKILVVLRKQPDGRWLRAADAWSSDAPPT